MKPLNHYHQYLTIAHELLQTSAVLAETDDAELRTMDLRPLCDRIGRPCTASEVESLAYIIDTFEDDCLLWELAHWAQHCAESHDVVH